ncbi:phosphonate C-P lyase system protein PhnH [Pseudonocardia alaniniphila]|uniref:Phosphonate C-P lyase system protein PhnH n=1 Tax=Pseudonocardia alaniniphila TaxID=75291 RepID=A0ABS9T6N7_9PSEU|nr:phosphonate C-P lyase system protein PhnH [Pseudonocardia alaniniphila]MCH6164187.1 phosphonate C-P lyase system protein PhnH [Pseudonocardia alaniniphila]
MSAQTAGGRSAARLRALDHTDSQATFRVLLDALSRPGTVHRVPEGVLDVDVPAAVLVPLALADLEVDLAVLEPAGPDWAAALAEATGARPAAPERADLVLALRSPRPDEIRGLRRGTPDRPDLACRLVLACDRVDTGAADGTGSAALLDLSGPGVDGHAALAVSRVPLETIEALVAVNRRFPLGVDTYLVDTEGRVAGLPRSTAVRITSGAGTWAAPTAAGRD